MINKCQLLGRVGKKDSKTLKNDTQLTNLSIATSKRYKDQQGNKQEKTTWHNVNLFGKIAEIAEKYVAVGDLVYIEGEMEHRKYTDKDGAEKMAFSINGNELKLLPKSKSSGDSNASPAQQKKSSAQWQDEEFDDSEIPF